jgi:hypothetical protein
MSVALPTAKRRAAGLGVHHAGGELGKRRRTQHFEDDGDDESDEERETTNRKHHQPDLGNIGYAAAEKKVMQEALENGIDGVKRYGDKTGKWEEKDEKLMAFNLKQEMEDGYFDEEGVYVENKAEEADPRDAWLDDFKERNDGKFAKAEEQAAAAAGEEEERAMTAAEKIERQRGIIKLLERGENVAQAIKRLRAEKELMAKLTDLASDLLNAGQYDIYSTAREDMQDAVDATMAKAAQAEASKAESAAPETWEYKLTMEGGAEVHGPFSSAHMQAWMDAGYFKDKPVWVRRTGTTGASAAAAEAAPAQTAGPAGSGAEGGELAVGTKVTVTGLKGAAQHNGKQGTIVKLYPATGRYVVTLSSDDTVAMKGENLIPPGAEAPAQQEDAAGSKEPFRSSDTIDCFDMF